MPLGWRFAARSNASPHSCANGDPPARLGGSVTEAFADRTLIDWPALLGGVRDPAQRGLIDALRSVDGLRSAKPESRATSVPRSTLIRVLLLLAVLQMGCALAYVPLALANGPLPNGLVPQIVLAVSFGAASLLLASAMAREPRGFVLLATLMFAGAAFARALLTGLATASPLPSTVLFRGLFPEAFAPAALWQFAVLFPHVRRFTTFDRVARRAAATAWWLSASLFLVNLLIAYGVNTGPLNQLRRDDAGNLFWHLFVLASCPAMATIFIRAYRADGSERRRVLRFAGAITAGTAPFLLAGLARMLLPAVDRWMLSAGSGRLVVDLTVLVALAGMPLLVAMAVIVDQPFDDPAAGANVLRRLTPTPCVRPGNRFRVTSWPARRRTERLSDALERVRQARGSHEILAVLRRELQFGLHASRVAVVDPAALPRGTALLAILEECSRPLDLSRDREPFTLLPRHDQDWLDANGVALAAPLHTGDGTPVAIVLLGRRRDGAPWRAADTWFIRTLLTGAATAWDARTTRRDDGDAALECARCGRIAHIDVPCCRGAAMIGSLLPRTVGGKFTVVRRLGAGGAGVVYLGHDIRLDREVALKTLPAVRHGIAPLRDEARAMATLNHDSLATIYGLEIWRRTPVLIVEYFPMGTLAERLTRARLPVADALKLGIRIADGLTYMHNRGILHRDLKPSNIGFTADGSAKLFDFGLATDGLTLAGTPGYLPPEAFEGAAPDVQVDLWGLARVVRDACGDHPADPGLLAFFDRALAFNPAQRFRSAVEVRDELTRLGRRLKDSLD